MKRVVPYALAAICALWVLSLVARPPHADDPALAAFAKLPVSFEGRLKPMDSVARNALRGIQGKATFQREEDGERLPAARWLLDALARPAQAADYAVFRVDHPDVLGLLGRRQESSKTFLSASDLREHQQTLFAEAQKISQIDSKQRTSYEVKLLELAIKLNLFERLTALRDLHVIPPLSGEPDWLTLHDAMRQGSGSLTAQAAVGFGQVLKAYAEQDDARFAAELETYTAVVTAAAPEAVTKAALETRFNAVDPFFVSQILYVLAFVLCPLSWLFAPQRQGKQVGWAEALVHTAVAVALVSLAVQTVGLGIRVYLMDRPPVTNLYSSAVFVGWGAVIVALGLERVFKNGVGVLTAAMIGWASLRVAQGLAADGNDTMAVLQAVLDTNFWLATHVVIITLGYSATFLAGFLGLVFVAQGMFSTRLDRAAARNLTQMIYGIVCFATLFSFVGTILGGIWADQSWGRFWGWDPKENGALLIVLWNAVLLHARWGGMVRQRGIAVLAILGNVVTAWSWFGTNMMGVGLHSYGFMEQAAFWLLFFVGSQIVVAGVASLLPLDMWRSNFQAPTATKPKVIPKAQPEPATGPKPEPAPEPESPAPEPEPAPEPKQEPAPEPVADPEQASAGDERGECERGSPESRKGEP